jgi:hypothetical protein
MKNSFEDEITKPKQIHTGMDRIDRIKTEIIAA